MQNEDNRQGVLRPGFTPLSMWAFSLGTSIGWGSFIVTCNTYLQKSGLLGTVLGLLLGMAVILVITRNLTYMIESAPDAGGVFTFEKRISGKDLGFVTFWFVLLTYMAILWANITSVPLFARFFLGNTFQFGFHYTVFGYEVWMGEALLSIVSVVLIGRLCAKTAGTPGRVMIAAAFTFITGFTVCALIAVFCHDSSYSYAPMYTAGAPAFGQIIRIAVISPWAFIGFENISHFSSEYTFPVRKVRKILISSVLVTTALYLFVSLLSVSAYPPEYDSWIAYISDMSNLEGIKAVPAFYAADHYLGVVGVTVLMLALFAVILTSLIGNMLALSRLLYAAGRDGEAPHALSHLNTRGIPDKAIYAIVAVSVFIPFLGRTAIGWIVDVTTLGATIIYGLISYAVYRLAKQENRRTELYTGIIGMAVMLCFIQLLLIPGMLPFNAMETESYILFIVWAVLGLIYFRVLIWRDPNREYGQRIVVWIILLVLVLFASMMWVSRATENAANNAVERIYEYHNSYPEADNNAVSKEERVEFLKEQAKQISKTNMLYSGVSLFLFLIFTVLIMNNYQDTVKLGRKLTAAEKVADDARKIAELKESISTLLDNMPALSFSKDMKTGVYLACNQAFAEYANRNTPDEVVGLTDDDIFDEETAMHFAEDDKIAFEMNEPYIFYEDVPDALGNKRQFQTTKLVFIDGTGKLCLLGMCQDVTEMMRIQRENASTKKAYEEARSHGIIFTHIAQTLARGYEDLYYIDIETGDYIEYHSDEASGMLKEVRRGEDFFESCVRESAIYVHPDDREAVDRSLERETLIDNLDRNKSFIMTYRLISNNGPTYVSMKASRMEDDERYIVIGVTNVDEQMRQQKAAERVREEHIAYARINALTGSFLCVYVVDPETDRYREFSAGAGFENFDVPREGEDFFEIARERGRDVVFEDDLDRYFMMFTKEGIMSEIKRSGIFVMTYRLIIDGTPNYVQLKAALVDEQAGKRMVVGINNIDALVRQEEAYAARLAQAQSRANIDALTGVKNKHAYQEEEEQLNMMIEQRNPSPFAIVVLDVNDLKRVNDTLGHKAGDQYIRDACKFICDVFKKSPVFRVGGDEFAVVVQGDDYTSINELTGTVNDHNLRALKTGGIVVACGMAVYDSDKNVAAVFERADRRMYENKKELKKS